MTRKLSKNQRFVKLERLITAPESWDDFDDSNFKTTRETSPYKVGDDVPTDNGKRALIVNVLSQRLNINDPFSTLLPLYRVRFYNMNGNLSNNWNYIWPGHIERGFEIQID